MMHLGDFRVQDAETFDESRRKILRLAQALGFDEIAAIRLAAVYSELCRVGLKVQEGLAAGICLEAQAGGLALAMSFAFAGRVRPPLVAQEFFRSFIAQSGAPSTYKGLLPLPDPTFRPSEAFLEAQRDMLAQPSREELLRDLKNKNRELEREIAERKAAEEAVKKLSLVVEQSPVSVVITDKKGNIEYVNQAFCTITGYRQEEVLGQRPSVIKSGKTPPETFTEMWQTILAGKAWRGVLVNRKKSGDIYWEDSTLVPIRDTIGEIAHFAAMKEDITLRLRMEEAEKMANMQRDEALELISGSIRYASRIQQAVLPAPEALDALFAEHFVLWEPRDVVGGDIYWSAPWGRGGVFVLGDCTGHGVPGAFMTLIATGALAKALRDVEPGDVAGLVAHTHRLVQTGLNQHSDAGGSDDGMELGVCYLAGNGESLRFCGARFSLFILERGEVAEAKGDRRGIGYRGIPADFDYTAQDIALRPGQRFFLATDGLFDQIGGERRRSYGKKRFLDLLVNLQDEPLALHGRHILDSLVAFQGDEKRRDDVSVAGFSVLRGKI
jgi:PAS domain S-box-containing protein